MNVKRLSAVALLICFQIYSPQGHSEIKNKEILLRFLKVVFWKITERVTDSYTGMRCK